MYSILYSPFSGALSLESASIIMVVKGKLGRICSPQFRVRTFV